MTSRSKYFQQVAFVLVGLFSILSLVFYVNYSSLIYGTPWTKASCELTKPFSGWDYNCGTFFDTLGEYDIQEKSLASESEIPTETVVVEAKQTPKAEPKLAKQDDHIESLLLLNLLKRKKSKKKLNNWHHP